MWQTSPRLAFCMGVGVLLAAGLPNLTRLSAGLAVAAAAAGDGGQEAIMPIVVLSLAYFGQQSIGPAQGVVVGALGRRINFATGEQLSRALLAPVGVEHLEDPELLDEVARARGALFGYTPATAVSGLAEIAASRLAGLTAAILVARFNVLVAAALVAGWRAVRKPLRQSLLDSYAVAVEQASLLRRANYLVRLPTNLAWAQESRLWGLSSWLVRQLRESWMMALAPIWQKRRHTRRRDVAAVLGVFGLNLTALVYVAVAASTGTADLALVVATIAAIPAVSAVAIVSNGDLNFSYGAAAATTAVDVHAKLTAVVGWRPTPHAEQAPAAVSPEVVFDGVTFAYQGREPVLRGIDLVIPAGRSLGIVGENGAGKTTLVKLLARLYAPQRGHIYIDGVDLTDLEPGVWRARLAVIFQDFVRYPLTARDNIAFGSIDRAGDLEAMTRAAADAGIADLIARLPGGWDTVLSRRYPDGADLSGGEWQRVAIARLLFAIDGGADTVVFDEPTARLDVRGEAEVFDALLEKARGRTSVLVSHRFGTIRHADRLVVVANGQVQEAGTHDELAASGGTYAHMFRLQAQHFDEQT